MNFLEAIASPFKKAGEWIGDKAKDIGSWFSDRVDDVENWVSDVATSDSWDAFLNGSSNKVNQEIAETNLDYQRQRNEIEDARYTEENAYNRAFSEGERDYSRMFAEEERAYQRAFSKEQQEYDRALQERIFEREDTAIQRQAAALSELGINPISQNLNGLGAGQALQSVAPSLSSSPSVSAPSSSSRGGQALFNKFQRQSQGLISAIAPSLSIAKMFQDYQTGNLQRDSLALANDRQFLANLIFAEDHGYSYTSGNSYTDSEHRGLFGTTSIIPKSFNYENKRKLNDEREWQGKVDSGIFDFDSPFVKNVKSISNMDFNQVLENALTNASKLGKGLIDLIF